MGIATSLKDMRGSHNRIVRFFASTFFFLIATAGILVLYAPDVSAATYRAAWINEANIKVTVITTARNGQETTEEFTYTDSNPNDTSRTFKGPLSGGALRCPADKPPSLTLGSSPAGGTLYTISSTPNCAVGSVSISITALSSAINPLVDCSKLEGDNQRERCEDSQKNGNAAFAKACGPPYPSGPLCVATEAPPYAAPPTEEDEANEEREPHPCDSLGDFSLGGGR